MKNRHHRKSKFYGGSNSRENVVEVDVNEHNAFTYLFSHWDRHFDGSVPDLPEFITKKLNAFSLLFGVKDPSLVCRLLNERWADPEYTFTYIKNGEKITFFVGKKNGVVGRTS